MDLKDKVVTALSKPLDAQYIRLEDDDGISGFVVSPRFEGMSMLDRQGMIERALREPSVSLTPAERRRILLIAGLTPPEYSVVGPRIRVHQVKELGGGAIEVVLHGGPDDAHYLREVLGSRNGVMTGDPKQDPGAVGILMSFIAQGTPAEPLTRSKVVQLLKADKHVEVVHSK